MILLCDFNPRIIRSYKSVNFIKNTSNTFTENRVYPSGHGIDMLTFLMKIGSDPELITYIGGVNGRIIESELRDLKARYDYVSVKDNNEERVLIKSINLKTTLDSKKIRKTIEDEENFYALYSRKIDNKDIVAFSTYDEELENIGYKSYIDQCYKKGIRVAVNVDDIEKIKESKPYLLIIEKETLENHTKLLIKTQEEVSKACNVLLKEGIGSIIINSPKGSIYVNKNIRYRVDFQKLDREINKSSSDLMLGAFCFAIERNYNLETTLKISVAAYIIENYVKFKDINMADLKGLMNEIELLKF
ncbi:MAG: PfkB family carbohydrate kinase [Peptoniphilus sp.]|nr:PfkB family carbohydrate kinase [Peptoniphilus sp.]